MGANDAAPKYKPRRVLLAEAGVVGGDSVWDRGSLVSRHQHNGKVSRTRRRRVDGMCGQHGSESREGLAGRLGAPEFVLGITCVHGQIIAVVDLRKVFGLPERGLRDSRQVIVLQSADMEFGILAERVAGVRRLPLAGLQPSLPTLTDVRAAYLRGIAPDGTVVLSAAKLLADPQLVVQQKG